MKISNILGKQFYKASSYIDLNFINYIQNKENETNTLTENYKEDTKSKTALV